MTIGPYLALTPRTTEITLANIAALRATSPSSWGAAQIDGYYTVGDGGNGTFYSVTGASAGTYVDNGGTIIVPTGGDGSSAWIRQINGNIDVLMFGADKTGATSSSAAFQSAIQALGQQGGTVLVPAGKFYLATSIVVTPAVSLKGPYEYIGNTFIGLGQYEDYNYNSALRVASTATIYIQGGGGISGFLIIPPAGIIPGVASQQWQGNAITIIGRGMLPQNVIYAAGVPLNVTVTSASPGVVNWITPYAATPSNGTPVVFTLQSGGTMPAGLTANTVYYVVNSATTSFSVAATLGGAALNTTSTGSGVICTTTPGVWSSGSLTITHNANYTYPVGSCITLNRATPAGYTAMYTVTSSTANTVTMAASNLGNGSYFLIQNESRGFISNIVPNVKTVTGSTAWSGTAGTAAQNNIATLTFGASTAFTVGDLIQVSGVTPSGYNGIFKVTAATTTSVSYYLSYDPGTAATPFTGQVGNATITHNMGIIFPLSEQTAVNINGVTPSSYNGTYLVSKASSVTTAVIPSVNTASYSSGGTIAVGYSGGIANIQSNTPSTGLMTITHNTAQSYPVGSTINVGLASPSSFNGAYTVTASTSSTVTVSSSNSASYTGDGLIEAPCTDTFVKNSMILGFNYGVYGIGTDRATLTDLKIDCQNGVFLASAYDTSHLARVHTWPFAAVGAGQPQYYGRGYAFTLGAMNFGNDWPCLVDCFCFGYNRGYWISEAGSASLIGCSYDGSLNNMGGDATAFLSSHYSTRNTIDNSYITCPVYGFLFDTDPYVATGVYTVVSNARIGVCSNTAFKVNAGTVKFFGCQAEGSPVGMQIAPSIALAYGSGFSYLNAPVAQTIAGNFCFTWSAGISTLSYASTTTSFYSAGDTIIVSDVTNPPSGVNGTYTVTSCTATSVSYTQAVNPKYRIVLSASLTIITSGTLSLTLPTGLNWTVGSGVIVGTTSGTPGGAYYYMYGPLATYNSSTGAATVTVAGSAGTGTFTTWNDVGPWPPNGNIKSVVLGTLNPMTTIIT